MMLVSIFSIGSLSIYFYDASTSPVESCQNWADSTWQQVDLGFNVFFLFYFFIRVHQLETNTQIDFYYYFIFSSSLQQMTNSGSGWIYSLLLTTSPYRRRLSAFI